MIQQDMVTMNMCTRFCSPHMYAQTTQSEQAPLKLTAKHVDLCLVLLLYNYSYVVECA